MPLDISSCQMKETHDDKIPLKVSLFHVYIDIIELLTLTLLDKLLHIIYEPIYQYLIIARMVNNMSCNMCKIEQICD